MSAIKEVVDGIREVLRMNDDLKRVADGLKALAVEVREHDGRLIRLETMVEIAAARGARSRPKRITKP